MDYGGRAWLIEECLEMGDVDLRWWEDDHEKKMSLSQSDAFAPHCNLWHPMHTILPRFANSSGQKTHLSRSKNGSFFSLAEPDFFPPAFFLGILAGTIGPSRAESLFSYLIFFSYLIMLMVRRDLLVLLLYSDAFTKSYVWH